MSEREAFRSARCGNTSHTASSAMDTAWVAGHSDTTAASRWTKVLRFKSRYRFIPSLLVRQHPLCQSTQSSDFVSTIQSGRTELKLVLVPAHCINVYLAPQTTRIPVTLSISTPRPLLEAFRRPTFESRRHAQASPHDASTDQCPQCPAQMLCSLFINSSVG